MNTLAITPKVESKIMNAAKSVADTASQYLGRDAILPEIKKVTDNKTWEYLSPCAPILEAVKPKNAGDILDFLF